MRIAEFRIRTSTAFVPETTENTKKVQRTQRISVPFVSTLCALWFPEIADYRIRNPICVICEICG
jgi:hypothetical protein